MRETDWIKSTVRVCITEELSEYDKKVEFHKLEKLYHTFSSEEKENIRNIVKLQFEPNDIIYIYSCFLNYMGNEEFAEIIIDTILEGDFDAGIGSMLELQTYNQHFRYLYKKIRAFHRKNVEKFDQILQVAYPYTEVKNRNSKRIVVVTEQLLGELHAPTKVVLNFLYSLKKMGYNLLLFVCPCDGGLPEDLWYQPMNMNSDPNFRNLPVKRYYQDEIFEGYQINMTQTSLKEYHMMLRLIHTWNPIFVLDLGTANPVVDLVGKFTTLVSWEMSLACPVSEGDVLIRLDRTEERLENEYEDALRKHQTQIFMGENFPVLIDSPDGSCTREQMKLPKNRFLIAIVGNRLASELDEQFLSIMRTILKEIDTSDFVIIGKFDELKEKFVDGIFQNRVYFLGFQEKLVDVYSVLDLYLNPDRAGGGFSSAMALIAGIPVVTLPDCDVSYNVGEEFVVKDYDDMIKTVARYVTDQTFYKQKASKAERYKEQNTDAKLRKYMEKLLNGVFQLIDEQE